ncbi:MAG TPA: LysR substrate-binding domain-containing protein [Burkholderiaceae bacterium]|jgi:DNA-binding transcriptional LysR family regulator
MDLSSLEILVAAIEEGSLSRAAERVNLVTSAASKRITELERREGTKLLQRHGRGVVPTPAGAMLYQQARSILRHVAQARGALRAYSASGVAQIRLVANSSAIHQFLPREIAAFARRQPESRVDLNEAYSYDIARIVAAGDADLGIYHAAQPATGVVSLPYRRDEVSLVVPLGHPLARRASLRLDEALDHDFLGYFPRHSLEEFLLLAGPTLSRPLRVRAQVSNPGARCAMVREGLGLAIVATGVARNYEQLLGLAIVPLEDAWAQRQMWVCALDPGALAPPAKALLEHLLPTDAAVQRAS